MIDFFFFNKKLKLVPLVLLTVLFGKNFIFSVGQDVQNSTALTWKNFKKLYTLHNKFYFYFYFCFILIFFVFFFLIVTIASHPSSSIPTLTFKHTVQMMSVAVGAGKNNNKKKKI